MGISGMMYTGLSGLTSTARSINVTGDNIANLNTVGYRGSRAIFEDVLNQSILGVGDLGGGTRIAQIEKLFHQGPIVDSPKAEDIAISGRGFFVVNGAHSGVEGTYYTRAGRFQLDSQGYLSTGTGLRVQGYPANGGTISSRLGDLRIDRSIEPRITSSIDLEINFDGYPLEGATPAAFDVANPGDTSALSQDIVIYDSKGTPRQVTIYFSRSTDDEWTWNMTAPSSEITGATSPPERTVIANGSLTFDSAGVLVTETGSSHTVDFDGAAAGQALDIRFGASTNTSLSLDGSADNSTVKRISQDGYQAGNYVGMQVNEDGTIIGTYYNGQEVTVGRLALADFGNQNALRRVGGAFFTPSPDSGDPVVGFPRSGRRGTLRGNALEQSNVDLSEEFVKLITDQRGYQAQSRTITTADELLSETVNLKR